MDDAAAAFQSLLYDVLRQMAVPSPMPPQLLADVRAPIEASYAWPTATVATFVELVAAIADAEKRRRTRSRTRSRKRIMASSSSSSSSSTMENGICPVKQKQKTDR